VKVRQPSFDFSDIDPVWADVPGTVHAVNAMGIVPAYVEPFLIKVMRRAKAELDPVADATLIRDIDTFNRQEAQHFKFHHALNGWVRENGYEGMLGHERRYADEYETMLATKRLSWLLAYCEGFEAMGLVSASLWIDGAIEAQLPNADPRVIALWCWHLAEEYEHRSVVFGVLKRLCGHDPMTFYLVRVAGFFNAFRHIAPTVIRLQRYLMKTWRKQGVTVRSTPKAVRLAQLKQGWWQLGQCAGVLSPRYDPANVLPPTRLSEALGVDDPGAI
jgi:hypothetical protein